MSIMLSRKSLPKKSDDQIKININKLTNELEILIEKEVLSDKDAEKILRYACSVYVESLFDKFVSNKFKKLFHKWSIIHG